MAEKSILYNRMMEGSKAGLEGKSSLMNDRSAAGKTSSTND
jgi:hypothetical protein